MPCLLRRDLLGRFEPLVWILWICKCLKYVSQESVAARQVELDSGILIFGSGKLQREPIMCICVDPIVERREKRMWHTGSHLKGVILQTVLRSTQQKVRVIAVRAEEITLIVRGLLQE